MELKADRRNTSHPGILLIVNRIKPYSFLLALLLLLVNTGLIAAPVPAPPQVAASGHLLVDFDSGLALSQENADKRLEPASLTKIMTTYAVFRELRAGNLSEDDMVLVSERAWKTGGSRMFIEVGKQVSVDDLIHGMIIQSGNDACVALAEHIAGSEEAFAELMNKHAARLGMTDTHFINATGLPDKDHYTTPADIIKVTKATIQEFPELYTLYAKKEFTFNNIRQHNRNKLLWRDESVDGVKTGHTEAAGYCLVSSAKRADMRLFAVVMGTTSEESRAKESLSLLNYGFRFYETHKLYSAGDSIRNSRVWKGASESVQLGLQEDLAITVPRGRYDELDATTRINQLIEAPVSMGQALGRIIITLDGEELVSVPLVALHEIEESGFIGSMVDSVLMLFE
jgi:D-alanyl-D-alanine carboxypeptidase (penicillin-binding protein 5/6)